ncbi:MAG: hypothetical protein ACP5VP_04195 [Candidatus Limnocylindrales bacterium]
MEPALAAAGAIVTAVAAAEVLRARTAHAAILGLAATLVLSPLALPSLPPALPLAFWLTGALLATYLLLLGTRATPSLLAPLPLAGWTEIAFVAFGLVAGWLVAPALGPSRGPASALAAGVAVGAASLPLLLFSRDTLRAGVGAILVLDAAGLIATAFTGNPGQAEIAALALAILGAAEAAREVLVQETERSARVGPDPESRRPDFGGPIKPGPGS